MITRLISLLTIVASFFMVYRYRYRVMNTVLGTRWIRNLLISWSMQIPSLRQRLLNRMIPS